MKIDFETMKVEDIESVIPFYTSYYNNIDGSKWTHDSAYKRIHQVFTMEGSLCLVTRLNSSIVGFLMGYVEQFDDLQAYNLAEIVVSLDKQGSGIGTQLMLELERRLKELNVKMIQLDSESDSMHKHFYNNKLGYKKAKNLVKLTKQL